MLPELAPVQVLRLGDVRVAARSVRKGASTRKRDERDGVNVARRRERARRAFREAMATREPSGDSFDGDLFDAPPDLERDYVNVGGARLVRPYAFDFVCHVKQRQAGLDVVDLFAREFPGRPRRYYEEAHRRGALRVERVAPARNKPREKNEEAGDGRKRRRADDARDAERRATTDASRVVSTEPRTAATVRSPPRLSTTRESESNPPPRVEPLRPLAAGERVRHYLHRHEPPTLSDPVTVLAVTDSMVAVHKPATVPVHPTGQYRKNTVLGLMAAARPDLGRLLPVHRLDKNVSGLLLMARDSASANRLREEVQSRSVRKRYVALVSSANIATGKHILETFSGGGAADDARDARDEARETNRGKPVRLKRAVVDVALRYDPRARVATCVSTSADATIGRDPTAKDARTAFALVAVSAADAFAERVAETSGRRAGAIVSRGVPRGAALVACEPLTGRTHQIRAHLKHLGHPIANDARYGGAAEADRAATRALLETCRATRAEPFASETDGDGGDDDEGKGKEEKDEARGAWPLCPHCPMMAHGANDAAEGDEGGSGARAEDLERLYLHCAEYRGAAWAFACPNPSWVPEDVDDARVARLLDAEHGDT